MRIKCILFSIEDTFYDSTLQISTSRINAIRAMVETGLAFIEKPVKKFNPL